MRETTVTLLCDQCRSADEVETVLVRFVGRKRQRQRDLCAKCRSTLTIADWDELMKHQSPRRGPQIVRPVASEAEVKPKRRARR